MAWAALTTPAVGTSRISSNADSSIILLSAGTKIYKSINRGVERAIDLEGVA